MIKLKDLIFEVDESSDEFNINKEFSVEERGLNYIKFELEKLNKKAAKWGVKPITIQIIKQEMKGFTERMKPNSVEIERIPVDNLKDADQIEKWITFKFDSEPPKVEGFQFVASIDHSMEAGNIVNISPNAANVIVPDEVRNMSQHCDVCKTNRDRNNTFILKKIGGDGVIKTKNGEETIKDGKLISVGRSCLKRFLNQNVSIKSLIEYALFLSNLIETVKNAIGKNWDDTESPGRAGGGSFKGTSYQFTDTFLKFMSIVYLKEGKFVSKKMANEGNTATLYLALNLMHPDAKERFDQNSYYNRTMRNQELMNRADAFVKKFYDWLKTKDFAAEANKNKYSEFYNYLINLDVLSKQIKDPNSSFPTKMEGYVSAMFGMFVRDLNKTIENTPKQTYKNEWIGNKGDKINLLNVKLLYPPKAFTSAGYGYRATDTTNYLLTFITEDGNVVTWWQSNIPYVIDPNGVTSKEDQEGEIDLSKKYNILNVSIKDHKEFKGRKQTVIKGSKATKVESVA
jgi:hypothetical protein